MPLRHYTGAWFPEGFFGSSFDALRREVNIEFRTAAKPNPPYLFLRRSAEPADKHVFSEHDNRHLFELDATHFDRNPGGRARNHRPSSATTSFQSFRWSQGKEKEKASLTTYQVVYGNANSAELNRRIPYFFPSLQMTIPKPHSSYRDNYTTPEQPMTVCEESSASVPSALSPSQFQSRIRPRPKTSQPRLTVADCLIWKPFIPPEKTKKRQ
ncbi:hypothetical protein FBUS_03339 [Fasciolopsis buskii]|uniref:Domain of unknown function with conserved HDNR motif domain-containing protein n=1 Tax=Fasciolopsis buskii TaxID=27845 RepID=A0A8E0RW61_9TREM|nr:hypothetical protein FBUS_03339 [Fasciolopsis buski]